MLPLKEAAAELEVTPQTIRRRLKTGKLAGFKTAGKFGPEWHVKIGEHPPPVEIDWDALEEATSIEKIQRLIITNLLDQIDQLKLENHRLRMAVDAWHEVMLEHSPRVLDLQHCG